MIAPGGEAPMVMGVLWGLTGLTFFFVLLRLYTRLMVLQAYGLDDHFFNFAFVLLLAYDVMLTLASHYGFGRNISELTSTDDVTHAILFEAIGQTILVVGTVVSKTSLALFLLRLVVIKWHQVVIMVPVVILALFVIASLLVFWFSCVPTEYLWNRFLPGGHCPINPGPISTAAGAWSVVVDFWYAGVPWIVLWNVQMPSKEKLVINLSMSLGVLAGACGIKRAMELDTLSSTNFTRDTVGLIVWHAAELAVTMVCIGIPVCRPLYKNWLKTMTSYNRSKPSDGYLNNSNGRYDLETIGQSRRKGSKGSRLDMNLGDPQARGGDGDGKSSRSNMKIFPDDASDDSILGPEYRQGRSHITSHITDHIADRSNEEETDRNRSIWVRSEVHIRSTSRG